MHFTTSFSIAATLLTLTTATPTLSTRSTPQCPGMSHLTPEVNCPSGFIGCVAYERSSEVCNGPKRFFNDCSGAPGLGSFLRCETAGAVTFIGCTTQRACDAVAKPADTTPKPETPKPETPKPETPKPETPTTTTQKWTCPAGTWYARVNECSSGFVGCTGESPKVCEGEKRFWGTCPPNHGNYYNCKGFIGCTTNTAICN